MGRDLQFYVVNTNIQHDKSCKICLDFECEPEFDELKRTLFEHSPIYHEYEEYTKEFDKAEEKYYNENNCTIFYKEECQYKINPNWCPRCHMFADGLYKSKAVLASIHFGNSYGNSIWKSDWHFYNMYPGKSHSDFCNRFNRDKMYREISREDIERLKNSLNANGKAYRTADLEAVEETEQVIKFCEKYLDDEGNTIIYAAEL